MEAIVPDFVSTRVQRIIQRLIDMESIRVGLTEASIEAFGAAEAHEGNSTNDAEFARAYSSLEGEIRAQCLRIDGSIGTELCEE